MISSVWFDGAGVQNSSNSYPTLFSDFSTINLHYSERFAQPSNMPGRKHGRDESRSPSPRRGPPRQPPQGLVRPTVEPPFQIEDLNPHLSERSLPQSSVILIPVRDHVLQENYRSPTVRTHQATLQEAFPYLPVASYLAIMVRLSHIRDAITAMAQIMFSYVDTFRQARVSLRPDPNLRFVRAALAQRWSANTGPVLDFLTDHILADADILEEAERVRMERERMNRTREIWNLRRGGVPLLWPPFIYLNSILDFMDPPPSTNEGSPGAHARRIIQRFRDIATLMNQLVPRTLAGVGPQPHITISQDNSRHHPRIAAIWVIRGLIRHMINCFPGGNIAIDPFAGIRFLRFRTMQIIGPQNFPNPGPNGDEEMESHMITEAEWAAGEDGEEDETDRDPQEEDEDNEMPQHRRPNGDEDDNMEEGEIPEDDADMADSSSVM